MLKFANSLLLAFSVASLAAPIALASPLRSQNGRVPPVRSQVHAAMGNTYPTSYYGKRSLYNQNAGADPLSWAFSGPALDTVAASLQRPYYGALGYGAVPRNYIYYDWGW